MSFAWFVFTVKAAIDSYAKVMEYALEPANEGRLLLCGREAPMTPLTGVRVLHLSGSAAEAAPPNRQPYN